MNYGEMFSKAAKITWKNKVLWIPAMIVGLMSTLYSILSTATSTMMTRSSVYGSASMIFSLLLMVVALIYMVVAFFSGTAQYVFTIGGILQSEQESNKLTIRTIWEGSRKYFWRVLGILVVLSLGLTVVITPCACIIGMIAGLSMASSITSITDYAATPTPQIPTTAITIAMICLLIPFMILALGIIQQCILAVVVDNCSFGDSLRKGFRLFGKKFGVILLASVVLGIIMFGVSYPVGWGFSWLTQKLVTVLINGLGGSFLNVILYGIAWLVSLPIYLVASAIVFVFTQFAWTFFYRNLTAQPPAEVVPAQ
jgi:hypothetical protein